MSEFPADKIDVPCSSSSYIFIWALFATAVNSRGKCLSLQLVIYQTQKTKHPPPPRNVNTEITKKGMYEHSPLTEEKTVVLQLVYNEMVLRFKEKKKIGKLIKSI